MKVCYTTKKRRQYPNTRTTSIQNTDRRKSRQLGDQDKQAILVLSKLNAYRDWTKTTREVIYAIKSELGRQFNQQSMCRLGD